jgi:hypothetical protein
MGERRTKSPGVTRGFPLATSPCGRPRTLEASRVSGHERHAKDSETGRGAVVAAHSIAEGGEVRPKRSTGGKAPSGRASAGRRQGRDFELTTPDHGTPGDCGARWVLAWAADALPEEPYALIAHVRVCGGAGWVTTGSTRHVAAEKAPISRVKVPPCQLPDSDTSRYHRSWWVTTRPWRGVYGPAAQKPLSFCGRSNLGV